METSQHGLTPTADQTPAVAKIASREPSGVQWVSQFPGSVSLEDLAQPFQGHARAFINALNKAGVAIKIAATYRPVERAYLMHWAWAIAKDGQDPLKVPALAGVNIQWDHRDEAGKYLSASSMDAAKAMTVAYEIDTLAIAPALNSRHTARCAIDMSLEWNGPLKIQSADGQVVSILSEPRTGMNA